MAGLLLFGHNLRNGDQNLDSKEPDAVLVVPGEVLEHGYHFLDNDGSRHLLHELSHVGGGLTAHHGGLIVDELSELLAQLFLNGRRNFRVGGCVEAASGDLGREPVGLGEANRKRDEVFFDLLRRELGADLVQRFDGLKAR